MDAILPSSGTSDVLASGLIRPPSGVCVLMSTYASETADNLRTSLESLYSQTIVPERIVLVIDGAIDHDQETVLSAFSSDPRGPKLTLVRLPQNGGLAAAMNAGLAYCDCPYVMRMDSDDVCLPDRLEHEHYIYWFVMRRHSGATGIIHNKPRPSQGNANHSLFKRKRKWCRLSDSNR